MGLCYQVSMPVTALITSNHGAGFIKFCLIIIIHFYIPNIFQIVWLGFITGVVDKPIANYCFKLGFLFIIYDLFWGFDLQNHFTNF